MVLLGGHKPLWEDSTRVGEPEVPGPPITGWVPGPRTPPLGLSFDLRKLWRTFALRFHTAPPRLVVGEVSRSQMARCGPDDLSHWGHSRGVLWLPQ